ncbi:MAG: MFS transporter [Acidimicrobiales bacterium]|jgi:MFS family permease
MWVIGFILMIDNVDQYIVRGMVNQLREAFHVGLVDIGFLISAFVLVNGVVTIPAGYMGDRWNRTRSVAVTIAFWSVISALGGVVPTSAFSALLVVRGLLGFGQAVSDPSSSSLLADYYSVDRRGRAFSVQQCLVFVGMGVGLAIGGLVGPLFHGSGWRLAFFISAIPGLVIAVWTWRLPEPRRGSADRAYVGSGNSLEIDARETRTLFPGGLRRFLAEMASGLKTDIRTILAIPTMRFALVGVSALLFTVSAVGTWMPQFYQNQLGLHQGAATVAFGGLVVLAGIPGVVIGGRIADRWMHKVKGARVAVPGYCLLASTTLFIASFINLPFIAVYPIQLVAFFLATSAVPALRAGLSDSVPANLRGTGFSAFNLAAVVFGSAAAPVIVSFVAAQFGENFRTAFLIVMPAAYIGAMFLLMARDHIEKDTAKILEAVSAAMLAEQHDGL